MRTMSTLPRELLADLTRGCAGLRLPRVQRLQLPPVPWNRQKSGEFAALVLEDGSIGLSYVLLDNTLAALAALSDNRAGPLLAGADPLELAEGWASGQGVDHVIGFAAINALTRHLFDRAGFTPANAGDSLGGLDPQPGDHIGMVGLFPPLIKRVTHTGARLTVLERRSELAGTYPAFDCTLDPADLATCNKVLSTSTVLLNSTLDEVLAHCGQARQLALIGPGAACLPDPLFRRGVTLMGGSWIEDGPAVLAALATGERWGGHARKFALARADYPGIDALRARID